MDDPNEEVNAKVVFVLGLNKPHAQLEMLQALMSIIQDDSLVSGIENAVNNSDVYKFLSN